MGQGKTSASITYMNEHPNDKFIFITPYLEEAERIKENCKELQFIEPRKIWDYENSKVKHTEQLIREGRNIATTHQAFKMYTEEMLNSIRDKGYTLIIDENIQLLEECEVHGDDIRLLIDAGYIEEKDNVYSFTGKEYNGELFRDLFWLLKSRQITKIYESEEGDSSFFFWILSPELIRSFKDVFILTYLFDGQSIYNFLKMYNMEYKYIYIEKDDAGDDEHPSFRFNKEHGYTPEYVPRIRDMIHILDNDRLNAIGEEETALSKGWFERNHSSAVKQLKNNLYNLYRHVWTDSDADDRMWSTFKTNKDGLKGKGYTKSFTVLNQRATNKLQDKKYLAYVVNLYMNVNEKTFFYTHGLEVDEDMYALSVMVQWIWRSAIRNGDTIYLYLPSTRMRRILNDWMDKLAEGGAD